MEASAAPAHMVGRAIALHYGVTVAIAPAGRDLLVSTDFHVSDADGAVEILSQALGLHWRKTGNTYFVGGTERTELISFPAAGFTVEELRRAFGSDLALLGDRVVMRVAPSERDRLLDVAKAIALRPLLRVRVSVVDVAAAHTPAFYDFLKSAVVGIQKTGNALHGSVTMPVDVRIALDFLNSFTDTRMKLDTELLVPSGQQLTVDSGSVIERPIYLRADQSDQDLVTRFDRLQLGLVVKLRPFEREGTWFLSYDVTDSDVSSSGTEKRLAVTGSLDLADGQAFKIASINRDKESQVDKRVPGISRVPLIGRAFVSKGTATESRVVMVFIQKLP